MPKRTYSRASKIQKKPPVRTQPPIAERRSLAANNDDLNANVDYELGRRLSETLDAGTLYEIQAQRYLDSVARARGFKTAPPNPLFEMLPEPVRGEDPRLPDDAAKIQEDKDAKDRTIAIARVVFRDGDALEFSAVPEHGEVGFAYHGTNEQRQSAAFGEALSPLRLFCSITPPDTPVPWLLAAVNPQIDRGALIEGRGLCNRLDVAVLAPMEQLRLRIPGLPGGWWVPDSYGSSNYCGISGEGQWEQEVCQFLQDEHSPGPSLIPNLYQCSAALQTDMLHESKGNGVWRSRNCSTASAAICGGTVEIKHQYRQLGFFEWNWVTARIDLVHPTNFTETFWLGIVRRRRRIRYLRVNSLDGGFRAASKFSQHLSSELWNHLVEVWGAD